jgi:hypothetical protein
MTTSASPGVITRYAEAWAVGEETVTVFRALRYRTSNDLLAECWLYDHDQHIVDQAWST